jgi:hypothetical protein
LAFCGIASSRTALDAGDNGSFVIIGKSKSLGFEHYPQFAPFQLLLA